MSKTAAPGLSLREGAIRGLRYGRGWADRFSACCWSQSVSTSSTNTSFVRLVLLIFRCFNSYMTIFKWTLDVWAAACCQWRRHRGETNGAAAPTLFWIEPDINTNPMSSWTRKRSNCKCIATWGCPTPATPVLFRFNYDALPSLKSLNLSIAVL